MIDYWDTRFLNLARCASEWSKDPSTGCGCILVDPDRRLISQGFNGLPTGVDDSHERLIHRETKLAITLHAELNAVLFARRSLVGCTCYVWPMPPCAQCASVLIQSGIKRIVAKHPTEDQSARWGDSFKLASELYYETGTMLDFY